MSLIIKIEKETEAKIVQTRKPWVVLDGELVGSEIVLDGNHYRVWTGRVSLARKYARANGWKIRELTGECELYVPALGANIPVLKKFGAKVKRVLTGEALEAARLRASNLQSLRQKQREERTSGDFRGKGEG